MDTSSPKTTTHQIQDSALFHAPASNPVSLDSLSILSELASSVQPHHQTPHTLSDEALHALLLASLSHQLSHSTPQPESPTNTLLQQLELESNQPSEFQSPHIQLGSLHHISKHPPPPPPSTANTTNIHINNQHQHAQDLLSALSALQSDTCDPINQTDHPGTSLNQVSYPQEEIDFDDPNLFSPFQPEHEQIQPSPDNSLLGAEINFLLGTHPFEPIPQAPSLSSSRSHKIYSNSFSSFQQHHQHEGESAGVGANHLGIYDPSNYPSHQADHQQDLSFLFENPPQPENMAEELMRAMSDPTHPSDEAEDYQAHNEEEMYQTDELLDQLDFGIKMNQDRVKLNVLDSLIESSLTFNQIYLNLIKKSLDNLNSRHQESLKFMSTSKQCINKIHQQEKQKQQSQAESTSTNGGAPRRMISRSHTPSSIGHNNTNSDGTDHHDLSLVSNQIRPVSLPWFKHKFGVDLPPFEDGKKRDQYNSLLHQQPWQPPERRKLDEEVGYQLSINQQNRNLINWDAVARSFPERKPIECKIQWTQKQDPKINKTKWTPSEIDRLFEIVKKHNFQNWNLISNELGTGRTPSDCVKQFRSVTQEKREWTESDDQLLKEGVSTYGQNWQAVAKHCGRSSNQCINRWSKTLRPDIKKGKWDPIEDEALKNAVAAVGMVWKDVAPRVRGRTDAQCRERWCNILDPRIVVGNWSKEEDERILRMRDVEGKTWSDISKSFEGRRTDNHCMRRHSELKRVKESKSAKKPMTLGAQQATGGSTKIRLVTQLGNHSSPLPISQSTLGKVLIPTNDRFSTRRNTNHNNITSSSSDHSNLSQNQPVPLVNPSPNEHSFFNVPPRNSTSRLRSNNKRIKYSS